MILLKSPLQFTRNTATNTYLMSNYSEQSNKREIERGGCQWVYWPSGTGGRQLASLGSIPSGTAFPFVVSKLL